MQSQESKRDKIYIKKRLPIIDNRDLRKVEKEGGGVIDWSVKRLLSIWLAKLVSDTWVWYILLIDMKTASGPMFSHI